MQLAALTIAVVALALALYLSAAWLVSLRRALCPSCGQRSLHCIQWIRATVIIDGRRAPDSWGYFVCESCGGKFKRNIHKAFTIPSEAEWAQNCSRKV
jgi:uncharacterized protein (DUF1684 family)